MRSQASGPVERYAALITKHIVSMKLVRLTLVLRPLFPYECEIPTGPSMYSGAWINIKKTSCQYRKSHCGDKTILRPSYLHNGISYTGKTASLYWFRALVLVALSNMVPSSCPVRRIPRQDPLHTTGWESLTNGWYTIIPKDIVRWLLNLCWKEKNENMQTWSRYSLFFKTLTADYQHRRLPP